jgi:predicted nucleotidyltransferase component of viral defense system
MIPNAFITQWRNQAPWQDDFQVEQDLIIERSLVAIFSHPLLKENLAFRGGTALHKLHLTPQSRYSEDIDLVQIVAGPIKKIIVAIQDSLSFLGKSIVKPKANNNTLLFRFISEGGFPMRLKVEINCREHFSVYQLQDMLVRVNSDWFTGEAMVPTFCIEELLATKLRAMYQRKKGRDLFDMWYAITSIKGLDTQKIIDAWNVYMKYEGHHISQKQFLQNMELKMADKDFLQDIDTLLHPSFSYDIINSYQIVRAELLEKL